MNGTAVMSSNDDSRMSAELWLGLKILAAVLGGVGALLLFLPSVQQVRSRGPDSGRLKLKAMVLAAHHYEARFRTFPPGETRGPEVTSLQSWQTLLLPYIERNDIAERIRLDAPWNDPINRDACTAVIPEYQHPDFESADIQGYPVTHYAGNAQVLLPGRGLPFGEIRDGSSNVIFCGEVGAGAVPWAQPGNVRDPALGLGVTPEQFGMIRKSGVLGVRFAMLDGSVRFFGAKTDPAVLKALASPDGGDGDLDWRQ